MRGWRGLICDFDLLKTAEVWSRIVMPRLISKIGEISEKKMGIYIGSPTFDFDGCKHQKKKTPQPPLTYYYHNL